MLRIATTISTCLLLAGCGGSSDPTTWFGGDQEEMVRIDEVETFQDPRPLVNEIIDLSAEETSSGIIVTATALTGAVGYWQAGLAVRERTEDSITYEFRAAPPLDGRVSGPEPSRQIVAAVDLGRADLAGLRTITVVARENQRTVQRR